MCRTLAVPIIHKLSSANFEFIPAVGISDLKYGAFNNPILNECWVIPVGLSSKIVNATLLRIPVLAVKILFLGR
jgi:hypothetical protein